MSEIKTILGLRCSSNDFHFCILNGTIESPNLITSGHINYPANYSECELIKWFYTEIGELISQHKINGIGIKTAESMAMKGKPFVARVSMEAVTFLQAAEHSIKYVKRKVKSTIAKDLGLKGQAKYLADFDYSKIAKFDFYPTSLQEAIQVGISML